MGSARGEDWGSAVPSLCRTRNSVGWGFGEAAEPGVRRACVRGVSPVPPRAEAAGVGGFVSGFCAWHHASAKIALRWGPWAPSAPVCQAGSRCGSQQSPAAGEPLPWAQQTTLAPSIALGAVLSPGALSQGDDEQGAGGLFALGQQPGLWHGGRAALSSWLPDIPFFFFFLPFPFLSSMVMEVASFAGWELQS